MLKLSNFTNQSLEVLRLAEQYSRNMGHNFVGTEQLLMGMFAEETNQAAAYLRECGVTTESLEQEIEKIIGRGSGYVAVEPPHTPRAKRVLEMAIAAAEGKSPVMPEHIFQSLLLFEEGVAMKVLSKLIGCEEAKKFIAQKITEIEKARQPSLEIWRKESDPALELFKQALKSRLTIIGTYLEAIAQVFGTALGGRCRHRPELVDTPIPLIAKIPTLPCAGGEADIRRLFDLNPWGIL